MRLLFLERDIDKALRRMALEEEKNLTETVNDILWKGLKDYLKQTGTNHVLHRKGTVSGFTPLLDKDGRDISQLHLLRHIMYRVPLIIIQGI